MTTLKDAFRDVVRALEAQKARAEAASAKARPAFVYERDTGAPAPTEPAAQAPAAAPPPARPDRIPPKAPAVRVAAGSLTARVRARLRAPEATREAFLLKEILDRPISLRRRG